ncbi:CRISPR-associated helicase/endonuclease Cas3 [Clostridium chauvoei]|uniref:CRISPR-associated helicase Cas3 n=5 Tax=Clostridium chauvoei TaxID=46867 RepID=S6F8R9_9CLOT|nr:CRISPR-associated helicase/endonuclease Cas3 [Clostridium chauvoei]CDG01443.1 Putative uncharacterized protein [Clostridium chauvoei JF4335]SLK16442.1 hypothetical protein CCH01_10540 [Clostridium chauvoei JF4335]
MYIEYLEEINIDELINKDYKIYAHINENKKETLKEHIDLCKKYLKRIVKDKNLEDIFLKVENIMLEDYSEEARKIYREMLVSTITLHDMGKLNGVFQKKKMNNNLNIEHLKTRNDSNHSIISSIIYLDIYFQKVCKNIKSKKERTGILTFMILNSYIISRHHGGFITDLEEYQMKICKDLRSVLPLLDKYIELYKYAYSREIKLTDKKINSIYDYFKLYMTKLKESEDCIRKINTIYIYERLLLSILIACDYYSTSEFMNNIEIIDLGSIEDCNIFRKAYEGGVIYNSIRNYEKNNYGKINDFTNIDDINILRNEMFLDAEKSLMKSRNSNIFYLEAPTGSGKSNVANNLAFKLLEENKRKIFYVYPFNSLVEQNIKNFKNIYEKTPNVLDKIAIINSLYPIKRVLVKNEEEIKFEEYEKSLLNRQFLNYPMILTTHVSIFRYLFGVNKEDVFPVFQLANSIIVLDEIQSYKNKIWGEIIEFLHDYAEILNIKIIIMSATLPDLDLLLESDTRSVNLIEDRKKYFENRIFKERVKIDFRLLDSKNIIEDLYEMINKHKNKKILVEFISKKSAYDFYSYLIERKELGELEFDIRLLTGDDNTIERENILNEIRTLNNILLISTQVIEAGVDIDMDIGFKSISIFDSEEQFLGRINRSCLKENSLVYFFKLDDIKGIYKEDVRSHEDLTIENKNIRQCLIDKSFTSYYEEVLKRLKKTQKSLVN